MDSLRHLHKSLRDESGMPGVGVVIKRHGQTEDTCHKTTVGEWLSRPEHQSGRWYIDGGWGGPPGPICVEWNDGYWECLGFTAGDAEGR